MKANLRSEGFLIVSAFQDEKGTVADVCIPISFIKNVSHMAEKSEIIASITPVIGKCAVSLIDSTTLFLDHTFEEVCNAIGAMRIGEVPVQAH